MHDAGVVYRPLKRLKICMSVSISHSAISSSAPLTFNYHFFFGAVKRDWLLILALQTRLQTTFNVVLELVHHIQLQ
jgi:hypothetical protein